MSARATRMLFAVATFVAAALVFLVQPMVARQLLPTFGGTPGVWNATVMFFQLALLGGYGFAHVSLRWLGPRRQVVAQVLLAVAALAFVPFALRTGMDAPQGMPEAAWIAVLLAGAVGIPYVAVASASPTLQRWYAAIGAPDSSEPWFLYAASNAGSLVGLLAFPLIVEPQLTTAGQELLWAGAFAAWIILLSSCGVVVRHRAAGDGLSAVDTPTSEQLERSEPPNRWRRARWVAIAALPVMLMLGVTTYITTDVASAPLLWVVPLALYLVSFMITFGRRWRVGTGTAAWATGALAVAVMLLEVDRLDPGELIRFLVHVAAVFAASSLAHAVLYADRPDVRHLTGFYLLVATGGAIGGMLASLAAPALLDAVYEYPLLLAAALLLRPAPRREPDRPARRAAVHLAEISIAAVLLLVLGAAALDSTSDLARRFDTTAWFWVIVVGALLLATRRTGIVLLVGGVLAMAAFATPNDPLLRERSFFGTIRVEDRDGMRAILHGTTLHGGQLLDRDLRRTAPTYYTTEGPLGQAMDLLQRDEPFVDVGVVGLGSGAALAHARLWQRFTFYEIDPDVIEVARDPELFTWISDADVDVRMIEGDARLRLHEQRDARYDLLVLDAYSSDAVPVHLLTTEAIGLYERRLTGDGVLLLHVSSRHLELEPVVAAASKEVELAALTREHRPTQLEQQATNASSSQWIALARDEDALAPLRASGDWRALVDADPDDAWTDDYSNVVGSIRWLPAWLR